jgi:hypothetical protein
MHDTTRAYRPVPWTAVCRRFPREDAGTNKALHIPVGAHRPKTVDIVLILSYSHVSILYLDGVGELRSSSLFIEFTRSVVITTDILRQISMWILQNRWGKDKGPLHRQQRHLFIVAQFQKINYLGLLHGMRQGNLLERCDVPALRIKREKHVLFPKFPSVSGCAIESN